MTNPIVFTQGQLDAIRAAAQSTGATHTWVRRVDIIVHFSTSGARDSFTTAISGIAKIAYHDQVHSGGAYCKLITPTA